MREATVLFSPWIDMHHEEKDSKHNLCGRRQQQHSLLELDLLKRYVLLVACLTARLG